MRKINLVATLVYRALFICSCLLMDTLTILLLLHFSRRFDNSTSHLNIDPRSAGFISIFHSWKLFQPNLKSKLLQPFSVATWLLKHVLLLQPDLFFPQSRRMYRYHLPITTIMFSINLFATAIVGTWDAHFKCCKNALSNMFPGRLETIIFLKITQIFPVPAKKITLLKSPSVILLLDSISWKTLSVPVNTVTQNYLSLF